MFCMHCGNQLPSGASFCPNCGGKAEPPSASSAPDASGGQAQAVRTAGDAPVSEKIESNMDFAIIITVLAVFNCGYPFNLILGIAAFLYANKVDQHVRSGDYKNAKQCAQTAKMLCWIASGIIGFQFLLFFLGIAVFLFAGLLSLR